MSNTVEWRSCRHRHTLFYHFIHFFENVKNLEAYFLTGIKKNIHVLMFLNKLQSTFTWTLPTLFLVIIFRTFNRCNCFWGEKFYFEDEAPYFLLVSFADQKMATSSFFFLLSEHEMLSAEAFLLPLLCKLNRFPHIKLHWGAQKCFHLGIRTKQPLFHQQTFLLLSSSTSHSRWITQRFSKSTLESLNSNILLQRLD